MPVLGNPALWRTHPYVMEQLVYIHPADAVYTARVNQASFTYPINQVAYDAGAGTLANVKPGMTIYFGSTAGARDRGWTFVRDAPDGAIIYMGLAAQGRERGLVDLADNLYITIIDLHEVWYRPGQIEADESIIWADTAYSRQRALKVIANGGVDVIKVTSGGTISVNFDATFGYSPSGTAVTYAWDFADGTPSTSSSATPTGVTFPRGARYVYLTATDGQSPAQSSVRAILVVAVDGADDPLLTRAIVKKMSETKDAAQIEIELLQDVSAPKGTKVLFGALENYGGTPGSLAGPAGREALKFSGWLLDEPAQLGATERGWLRGTTLEAGNIGAVLGRVRALPFTARNKTANDAAWGDLYNAHIDKLLALMGNWMTTAARSAPFGVSGTGTAANFMTLDVPGGSAWEQLKAMTRTIGYATTSDRYGRVICRKDVLRWDVAERHGTVIVDLDERDYTDIAYEEIPITRVGRLRYSGLIVSNQDADDAESEAPKAYARAPGSADGQGAETVEDHGVLPVSQAWLEALVGHDYARANAPEGFWKLTLAHAGDAGIVPGLMEWVRVTLPANLAAERGLTVTQARFMVQAVDWTYSVNELGTSVAVTLTLERETVGLPGVEDAPLEVPEPPTVVPPVRPPIIRPIQPPPPGTGTGTGRPIVPGFTTRAGLSLAAVTTDGRLYLSVRRQRSDLPWWFMAQDLTSDISGTVIGVAVDYGSPRYRRTGDEIYGWLLTTTGVYRFELEDTMTISAATTWTEVGTRDAWMHNNRRQRNFLIATRLTAADRLVARYSTNGTSFSADVDIDEGIPGGFCIGGVYVSGKTNGRAYTSAVKSIGVVADGWRTNNSGAAWARLTLPDIDSETTALALHFPQHDNRLEGIGYFGSLFGTSLKVWRVEGFDTNQREDVTPFAGGRTYNDMGAVYIVTAGTQTAPGEFVPTVNHIGQFDMFVEIRFPRQIEDLAGLVFTFFFNASGTNRFRVSATYFNSSGGVVYSGPEQTVNVTDTLEYSYAYPSVPGVKTIQLRIRFAVGGTVGNYPTIKLLREVDDMFYGVQYPNAIDSYLGNRRRLILAGRRGAGVGAATRAFWTDTGGDTWIPITGSDGVSGTDAYTGVLYSDNNTNKAYAFGEAGRFGVITVTNGRPRLEEFNIDTTARIVGVFGI